jgi:alkylhydroperoxidase/carboxymuconolactone decarboxylase family protein
MSEFYYEKKDLADFPNIAEHAAEQGKKFFDYYNSAVQSGRLTEREKALIALAVATTQNCPYCIDAFTNNCLSQGMDADEIMEAVHVGAAMMAGVTLAHSTQVRKIIKEHQERK